MELWWVMLWWMCTQILPWKTVFKTWESCGFNYCTAGTLHLHTAYPILTPTLYVCETFVCTTFRHFLLLERDSCKCAKHVAKSRGGAVLSCHGCQTLLLTYSWCGCGLSDGVCVCVCPLCARACVCFRAAAERHRDATVQPAGILPADAAGWNHRRQQGREQWQQWVGHYGRRGFQH